MIITILIDNSSSWFVPFGQKLENELTNRGHKVLFCHSLDEVVQGDICFLLSCEKIVPRLVLNRNRNNIVIHSSDLPHGKGWSPLTWQILEGKNDITSTLFEAEDKVDCGQIYLQNVLHFEGHELNEEMKNIQGQQIVSMALRFVDRFPEIKGVPQKGEETFYARRGPNDSELDVTKTIAEQFNLLRVVDNERYPAFFRYRGHIYILKIYKKDDEENKKRI